MNNFLGILVFFIAKVLLKVNYSNLSQNYNKICNIKQYDIKIPKRCYCYLIISEDKRFYLHKGFDVYGILRAIIHFVFLIRLKVQVQLSNNLFAQLPTKGNEV